MTETMRAARLHEPGTPMRIERIERPTPRDGDVLVQVKACGIIPNMNTILGGSLWHHLPRLPAVMGLDAAGIVVAMPAGRRELALGQSVYVNPFLSCGACAYCRAGTPALCADAALRGYFGFTPEGAKLLERYPYGGLCEYLTAAPQHLVKLPPSVSFDEGARWGYLATSFAALRMGGAGAGRWLAINGVTGTLGVGAVMLALAMGVTRILGWGRNRAVLQRLEELAPRRVATLALGDQPLAPWVRERTEGLGVDLLLDCTGRGGPAAPVAEAQGAVKRGGMTINIGALAEPLALDPTQYMTGRMSYRGSNWFANEDASLLAEMVATGVLDLSPWTPRVYPLDAVNDALADIKSERPGGFVNFVVAPDR
ncbi:MAG TPA: alcohol dehydrogenase catalytic domain-containing protein [Stellaceae bacterium]|nr:alcohol dehydrogenase catalytic domain-containing protein [Stellaceae bacterium]